MEKQKLSRTTLFRSFNVELSTIKNRTMLIQKYQKSWIIDFNKISKIIDDSMINLYISIEHIGSTSVPGLAAKLNTY